jgi:hypothetical protein
LLLLLQPLKRITNGAKAVNGTIDLLSSDFIINTY